MNMKEFDEESLLEFDGKDGKPVYVAHDGKVYDVSASRFWKTGTHMKRHPSGKDLTVDIAAAPHGPEVLGRYPQVGTLKKEKAAEDYLPAPLGNLLMRYPVLRRHPHPMVVHFPIVFMFSALLFNILYFLSGYRPFEVTALHCLGGGVLFTPVGIVTGFLTWWINYAAKPSPPVRIKIYCSLILLGAALAAFVWRIFSPDVLTSFGGGAFVYLVLLFSLPALVTVIGWYGAGMTFPVEKK
jgi:predicted heme/steroid binding protein/uncharacterized membrane protein